MYHCVWRKAIAPNRTVAIALVLIKEEILTENDEPENKKKPKPKIDYDWRDPSKPRNPEDDEIVDGWRRCADGTFEKIEDTEAE